jgi:hypothetical protein
LRDLIGKGINPGRLIKVSVGAEAFCGHL